MLLNELQKQAIEIHEQATGNERQAKQVKAQSRQLSAQSQQLAEIKAQNESLWAALVQQNVAVSARLERLEKRAASAMLVSR